MAIYFIIPHKELKSNSHVKIHVFSTFAAGDLEIEQMFDFI